MIVAQDAKTFQDPISGVTIRLTAVAICASFWVGVAYYLI